MRVHKGKIIKQCVMKNGLFHNTIGPAIITAGNKKEWWINGEKLSYEEWIDRCFDNLTEEKKEELIFNGFEWID